MQSVVRLLVAGALIGASTQSADLTFSERR
jgi:hypothetical protein